MKTYYANPNYAEAANSDNWVVVGAQSSDVATNDLTQLAVGNISAPTGTTATGYYFAQIEDLSRLMKGWSYLTKTSLGPRNIGTYNTTWSKPNFQQNEPYLYVAEINGFQNGDTLAILEGQQENQAPYSSTATSSDYGFSEWSVVRNAGLIPTVAVGYGSNTAFLQPENTASVACRLLIYPTVDYGDTDYGNTYNDLSGNVATVSAKINYPSRFTPTPDNLGTGTVKNWYVVASGDDTAKTNITTLLPDFTTNGELVNNVMVGQTSTQVTLSNVNSGFKVGQTLTIVTNGAAVNSSLPSVSSLGTAPMGFFTGKITAVSATGGVLVLTTDLNDTTADIGTLDPLPGSLNTNVNFTGTISTTTTITISAYTATNNYGLAAGQTVTGGTYISAGTTITSVAGNGPGAVITLSQAVAGVVGTTNVSFAGSYTDNNLRAYAATITNYGLQVNYNNDKINAVYSSAPYYAYNTPLSLSSALSTTGATTQVVLRNNNTSDTTIYGSTNGTQYFSLQCGDNYQEIAVTSDTTITAGGSATVTVTSFTPNFAYPARTTSVVDCDSARDNGVDRYGKMLILPVIPQVYKNAPVARFKSMTPTTITETISGATYTLYYGTVGSPAVYYSEPPYVVSVDSVSGIAVGDTLTFRNDYNPWFSNYRTNTPPNSGVSGASTWSSYGDATPWTWTLTEYASGFTCTSGATYFILPDANGYSLPLVIGQTVFGANPLVLNGTFVTGWNATQVFLSANTVGTTAVAVNLRFYPGKSGYNYWKVYSVDTANNAFTIYGSSGNYSLATTSYSANGDSQNSIYPYDNHFYAGNTIDTLNSNGLGAGVVGMMLMDSSGNDLGPEPGKQWHTTNTVVGSYAEGARYIGSQSVGDQEQVKPFRIGTLIGTTLALDVIAQNSTAFTVNALPTSAAVGNFDPLYRDTNQYGMNAFTTPYQYGGFTNLGTSAAYSTNYSVGNQFPIVVGQGQTQVVVLATTGAAGNTDGKSWAYPQPVDGSNSTLVPMIWYLVAGQSFQYDHAAGEPVCLPNFIYNSAGTISHAASAPVIGLPNTGTVYG